jgi:hypothetical protein
MCRGRAILTTCLGETATSLLAAPRGIVKFFSDAQRRSYDAGEAKGKAEGEAKGKAEALLMFLRRRGLVLTGGRDHYEVSWQEACTTTYGPRVKSALYARVRAGARFQLDRQPEPPPNQTMRRQRLITLAMSAIVL